MSQERTPLQPSSGTDDGEKPAVCGSHIDKLCLLPFFAIVTALGYYGVQGVQSFNIYEAGEKNAKALCSPLAELQDQCKAGFKDEMTKAAALAQGPAADSLDDAIQAALGMNEKVADACSEVEKGLSKCGIVQTFVSKGHLLDLPQVPTLPAKEAHRLKKDVSSFVDSLSMTCGKVSDEVKSICSNVDKTMAAAGVKVDEALKALVDNAPKKVEDAMLKALAKSSKTICPALGGMSKACGSLKASAEDALQKAESAADESLPKEVPRDLLLGALKEANAAATGYVDGICKDAVDVAKDCPSFFAESRWQPLVGKVREPLEALRKELKDAADVLKDKVSGQCSAATSEMQQACSGASDAAGAVTSQIGNAASEKSAELQQRATVKLQSLHDDLSHKLSKVNQTLEVVVSGCSQAGSSLKMQCKNFRGAKSTFSASAEQVQGSLRSVSDAGTNTDEACRKLHKLEETCLTVANPAAILAKGATGLWQHHASGIVQLEGYLVVGAFITAIFMLGILKMCTKVIVIVSIVFNLGGVLAIALLNLSVMNFPGAIMFGTIFLLKALWFWCIRHKLEFAVVLIHTGVEAVEDIMGVGVWILGLILIFMQGGCLILTGGAWYYLMGTNAPPEAVQLNEISPVLIPVLLVFALAWTSEVIPNVLHVTICCSLGNACGVQTPAKSSLGSFFFAVTGGLGSICLGSFIIALLKALQYAYEKGTNSKNPVVQVIIRIVCCVLQWILKLFNAYAFVFVGLKGTSYCDAAYKTAEVFAADGVAAIAANEALHDVVHIAKLVSMWVAVLLSLILGHALDLIGLSARSWQEILSGPILCIALAMTTSYALSMVMGRLLEAAVCTLFIVFDHPKYQQCMKNTQPKIFEQLLKASEGNSKAEKAEE